ncbi:hypothetical protein SIN01_18330 [Sporolactobacillus inulinus]|nr:hypothetical protein SIN01_18330 [Sporolactobacillus inulinus]
MKTINESAVVCEKANESGAVHESGIKYGERVPSSTLGRADLIRAFLF